MASSARTMGVTVTMGACTTLASGSMLWLCTLTFFTKFAVLVVGTIGFSLVVATLFFMPVLATIGPEGTQGDIVALYRRCHSNKQATRNGAQEAGA
jgi:hypothetical protein